MIDAGKGFEKDGNKNRLRAQDIHKIVDVFTKHLEIPKYSRLVSVVEIEKNEFNLNIPRYVDTFEAEEEIDIQAVMQEIKSLEAKRAALDKEIDVYFKELGLVF